ncbi:MAG: hypothetical protein JOY71_19370 [Acetobacteraceae bacterium]|nr:hypothetical protein [Acetobacteraceae bacterium]MBV8524255.1 hypothetical protein [Acetobacteraceae bacterium]MBV8590929.1 hypothetical protein [Acetobacteraceae bacterium]
MLAPDLGREPASPDLAQRSEVASLQRPWIARHWERARIATRPERIWRSLVDLPWQRRRLTYSRPHYLGYS